MPEFSRQFVACSFKPGGRTFTYHNDGEPVAVGERVKVPAPRDEEGYVVVTVEQVVAEPKFPTKGILGLIGDGRTDVENGDDSTLFGGAH